MSKWPKNDLQKKRFWPAKISRVTLKLINQYTLSLYTITACRIQWHLAVRLQMIQPSPHSRFSNLRWPLKTWKKRKNSNIFYGGLNRTFFFHVLKLQLLYCIFVLWMFWHLSVISLAGWCSSLAVTTSSRLVTLQSIYIYFLTVWGLHG